MHKAHTGDMRNKYRILAGKPKGKRPLGRHRHKLKDNIKWILEKQGGNMSGCVWLRIGASSGFL